MPTCVIWICHLVVLKVHFIRLVWFVVVCDGLHFKLAEIITCYSTQPIMSSIEIWFVWYTINPNVKMKKMERKIFFFNHRSVNKKQQQRRRSFHIFIFCFLYNLCVSVSLLCLARPSCVTCVNENGYKSTANIEQDSSKYWRANKHLNQIHAF